MADLHLALDYIKEHLAEYGGDLSQVYACGDSGGACLLTYGAAMQKNKTLAKAAGITPSNLPIRALGLISGMFYTNRFDEIGIFLPRYLYGKRYKKSSYAPYISPEHKDIVESLPPSLLITSENDNLQKYTLDFEKALARHQMPHKLINFPTDPRLTHAFSVFYPDLPESKEVIHELIHFFEHTEDACKGGNAQ